MMVKLSTQNTVIQKILILLISCLFVSCKVGSGNNTNADSNKIETVKKNKAIESVDQNEKSKTNPDKSLTQNEIMELIYQNQGVKINPDEAVVSIVILDIVERVNDMEYLVKFNKLEKSSFGFSAYLRGGDKLMLISRDKGLNIKKGDEIRCIIEEIISPEKQSFRLIRIL